MQLLTCIKYKYIVVRILILAVMSPMMCTLPSCHSSKGSTAQEVNTRPASKPEGKRHKPDTPAATSKMGRALVSEARKWLGTPYVYGGHSRKGTDCSGFLMEIFRECAGIDLPRSSRDQQTYCHPIDREYLAVGDLVFFSSKRSGGRVSHVGMYIGDGRMIHASSSRGVVEDDLSLQYYITHYQGAGRVPQLATAYPLPSKTAQTAESPQPPETTHPSKNTTATKSAKQKSENLPRLLPTITPDTTQTRQPESIVRDAFSKTKKN